MAENALEWKNLRAVLKKYGQHAEELYKYNLALKGKNASRKLSESVKSKVYEAGREWVVSLSLEDYWKYIEHGRKPGKFPPVDKIREWVEVKPILPRPMTSLPVSAMGERSTRIPSPQQLAFLIARKIYRDGIEPTPVMETTIDEVYNKFISEVRIAIRCDAKDLTARITALKPQV